MRMTEQKFNRLKRLTGKLPVSDIADIVGLKPQSIPAYGRFKTWEDYQAYKVAHNAKQRAMKKPRQLEMLLPQGAITVTAGKPTIEELLVDINNSLQRLIELETNKMLKREAYYASKNEMPRRSSFRSYWERNKDE